MTTTIDDLIEAATAAAQQSEGSQNPATWYLYQAIGPDRLEMSFEAWGALCSHVSIALGSARAWLEYPLPAGVITAAVVLGVDEREVAELVDDVDRDILKLRSPLHQQEVAAAYEHTAFLVQSLRHMLYATTVFTPRMPASDAPVPSLATATADYRAQAHRSEETQARFYAAIRSAHAGGMRPAAIVEATGVTRRRVHQIINHTR
jgi:hypothetical protein